MMQVLKVEYFTPFISSWGVVCQPMQHADLFYVPLGWQQELTERGIAYEEVTIDFNINELPTDNTPNPDPNDNLPQE